MDAHQVPTTVIEFAGLVMAQAASIASVLQAGDLICPFVVVTKGENRQAIDFEAETQEEAVANAWASLEEYREHIDMWALAREGIVAGTRGKDDVLVVCAWAHGMEEPVMFSQRFVPKARGEFALIGPVEAEAPLGDSLGDVSQHFMSGVLSHPKGDRWQQWKQTVA